MTHFAERIGALSTHLDLQKLVESLHKVDSSQLRVVSDPHESSILKGNGRKKFGPNLIHSGFSPPKQREGG